MFKASFPAPSGFSTVASVFDEESNQYVADCVPIVGFVLDEHGVTEPVTIHGCGQHYDAILVPDGRVLKFEGEWASLDDWVDYQNRKAK